jgi:hypothetical protein
VTVWYDGKQMYQGPLDGLRADPVTGLTFSTYFDVSDTSQGPKTDLNIGLANFTVSAVGAASASPSASRAGHTTPPPGHNTTVSPAPVESSKGSRKAHGVGVSDASTISNAKSGKSKSGKSKSGKSSVHNTSDVAGLTSVGGTGGETRQYYVTLYGAHDNTPANSRDIAYPDIHKEAGGTGTFADPTTFATDKSELAPGTKIYYPYLKRYFIMEDDCTECDDDWKGHGPNRAHIDLWAGASNDAAILPCEEALTQDGQVDVVVNPPDNLPVDAGEVFHDGKCYKPTGK